MSEQPSTAASSQPKARRAGGYHHGDLRSALLDAARQLIEDRGPNEFTMKDASQMAGVSVAAPYRHFSDREGLLAALTDEEFRIRATELETIRDSLPLGSIDAIIAMGQSYVSRAVERPGLFHLIFGSERPDPAGGPHHLETSNGDRCFGALVGAVMAFVEAHSCPKDDVMGLVGQLWSIVHGAASLQIHHNFQRMLPEIDTQALIHDAAHNLLTGYLAGQNRS